MAVSRKTQSSWATAARILVAIVGGYVFTNLLAILVTQLLPGPQEAVVMTGLLITMPIYAVSIMWVFAVKDLRRASIKLLLACILCFGLIKLLMIDGAPI